MTSPSDTTDGRPLVIRADDQTALVIANLERKLEAERHEAHRLRDVLDAELRRWRVVVSLVRASLRWIETHANELGSGVICGYARTSLDALAKWERGE